MQFHSKQLALTVTILPDVVEWFIAQRQTSWLSIEAGGQLFGRATNGQWVVEICTGPRPTDVRSTCRYAPDVNAENKEIMEMYERGMHFLGDWHTHYQKIPTPSRQDIVATQRCYHGAITGLPGFLMIVVGKNFPEIPCSLSYLTESVIEHFKYRQPDGAGTE